MHRDTQNVILLLLGGTMIRISVDDTVLRYVRADHRWWVLAGGIVIVVLAAVAALRDHLPTLLGRKRPPEHHHDQHEHRERLSPWLMVVPALVLAVAAPAALGANTLTRTALPTAPPIEVRYDPLPPGDAPELTFMEFVSRAGSDDGATLTGRTVTLVGFTAPGSRIARIAISCCAADARPQTVRLLGEQVPGAIPDTWLRITGTLDPGSANPDTNWEPALYVRTVQVVPMPEDPYEY